VPNPGTIDRRQKYDWKVAPTIKAGIYKIEPAKETVVRDGNIEVWGHAARVTPVGQNSSSANANSHPEIVALIEAQDDAPETMDTVMDMAGFGGIRAAAFKAVCEALYEARPAMFKAMLRNVEEKWNEEDE
jgi:hypothetical protein